MSAPPFIHINHSCLPSEWRGAYYFENNSKAILDSQRRKIACRFRPLLWIKEWFYPAAFLYCADCPKQPTPTNGGS